MSGKLFVILEQRDGTIKKSSFEACSLAAKLAATNNLEVTAVVVGAEIVNISQVGEYGITRVIQVKHDELSLYSASAYKKIIMEQITKHQANLILFANTAFGKDLAPRIAVKLDAGILMDCIELSISENGFKGVRPVFAGKALQEIESAGGKSVASIRPNIFPPEKNPQTISVELVTPENLDLSTRTLEVKRADGKLDVAEADIIVSGGRGLKGPEHFHLIEELAAVVGGAVGASRAVVDAGWRPHGEQVGQTGKTVSPSLYIACGISGAIQHLAGMSSSKYIVAINKDKDAPIFSVADYGITGDVFEILPALTEEIKKLRS